MKKYYLLLFIFLLPACFTAFTQTVKKGIPFAKANFGSPARIPGAIQAEDFDEGGEGVAYHNIPPIHGGREDRFRNLGLDYRDAETEIEIAYGTNMLAAIRNGEWWKYTVEVMFDGIYELDLVSSGWHWGKDAGAIRIFCDGVDLLGLIRIPYTSRWQDFSSKTFSGIKLTKGIHELKVVAEANDNINLDLFRFRREVSRPFNATYHKVPGMIEAEDFDEGSEGVSFHNVDPVMDPDAKSGPRFLGLQYRKTPVELEKGWGTMMLAAIKEGEWWKYLMEVDHDGVYDIEVSVARWNPKDSTGLFRIEIEGKPTGGSYITEYKSELIKAPLTGKWFLFKTVTIPGVKLKKGVKQMKVINEKGNELINLDSYRFTEIFK